MKKTQIINNNQLKYVISEWNIMKKLENPFIVSLKHAFQTPKYLYLVMEFCSGKDLSWHLDQRNNFNEPMARLWIAEVILAIEYLHNRNIIYRDLKPSNVLVTKNGHVKLTDFGLAKENMLGMDFAQTFCGSPAYLAPELIKERKFNKSSDIYQIGVLLFELLTGRPPFFMADRESLFECIKNSYDLEVPPHVSMDAIDLLGRLLNKLPHKRIGVKSFDDLKNHKFFKDINWDDISSSQETDNGIFQFDKSRRNRLDRGRLTHEEVTMNKIKSKVDFYDEDYKEEEYSRLGKMQSRKLILSFFPLN